MIYDPIEWRRLGRAIANHKTLEEVMVTSVGDLDADFQLDSEMVECVQIFFDGLKRNTTISSLSLAFFPTDDFPLFDLDHILRNNHEIDDVELSSYENSAYEMSQLLPTQNESIVRALENNCLSFLSISRCKFGDDGSLERILALACKKVEGLSIRCPRNFDFAVLVDLLQSNEFIVDFVRIHVFNEQRQLALTLIGQALVNNKTLKRLILTWDRMNNISLEPLCSLVCNTSTVESIRNSNHYLQEIIMGGAIWIPQLLQENLKLNKNSDKEAVIRQKISQYYFKEEFDVSPFVNMPLSVLLKVIGIIGGDFSTRQSAIVRLLKNIPELCNVSSRCSSHNKRHKIDKEVRSNNSIEVETVKIYFNMRPVVLCTGNHMYGSRRPKRSCSVQTQDAVNAISPVKLVLALSCVYQC
eukprot:scaffold29424_cov54-Cyclotella_meneghiniana.AAC.8